MKAESLFVLVIGMLTLAVLASGCASTKPSEDFFSAAGFNVMPANMPGRLAHLKALPPHQVTTVVRNGKTYLAYPDAKQKVLYVSTRARLDQYQNLRAQNQMAEEKVEAAQMNA